MSDISTLNVNGTDYDIKDEAARTTIQTELADLAIDEKVEIIKNRLNNALADTNAALVAKGATEVTKFDEVPTAIESIQSGGSGGVAKIQAPEDLTEFFPNLYTGCLDNCPPEQVEWFLNLVFNGADYSQTYVLVDALGDWAEYYDYFLDEGIEINVENFNAQNAENIDMCFEYLSCLASVKNVNNKSVIGWMDGTFNDCPILHTVTNLKLLPSKPACNQNVFHLCPNLVNLSLMEGEKIEISGTHTDTSFKTVDVSGSPLLSLESLVGILNAVVNKNASGNIRVYFGSENIAKLSDEHLALAAEKRIELV